MENIQLKKLFEKLEKDPQLSKIFWDKLERVKKLKNTTLSTEQNESLEKAWNELNQFALTVESGFTIEELKNFCEAVLNEENFDNISAGLGYNDGQMVGKFLKGMWETIFD
jgi:hypothetical protein